MMAKRDVRLMSRIPRPTSAENTPFFSAPQSGQIGGTSSTHQISAELLNLAALISTELWSRTTWGPLICFKSTQETSGFAQDTMRVFPNLSLTLGLRYDWQNTLDDRRDLAPRLALAFTPGKRTVLRAGAGMFYDNLPRSAAQDALLMDGARVREIDISHPSYPDPFLGGQVTSPPPSIARVASAAHSPYLIQTSAGVEPEICKHTWLSLEYSFLRVVHLFRFRAANALMRSGSGLRPDPNFSNIAEVQSTAFLRGHALTLTDRKSTRLNSSHMSISYAVFCLKKKKKND